MNQYEQVLNHVLSIQSDLSDLVDSEKLVKEIQQSAADSTLRIMLYGAYNAGKSTMINALLGQELAVVNDIPTTDKIDQYSWQGMYLLDTPGVNAPIDHEEVALEQLERCSTILFVIREGDTDTDNIYARLLSLLQKEKKIFIILNHQLVDKEDQEKAANHIFKILTEMAHQRGISDESLGKIEVCPINARTALNGRLRQHEKMIQHSGFSNFIENFESWLSAQNSEQEKFMSFKQMVDNIYYQPAINQLEEKLNLGQEQQQERSALQQEQFKIEQQRSLMMTEMRSDIEYIISRHKTEILHVLEMSENESEAQIKIENILLKIHQDVSASLKDKIENVVVQIQKNNSNLSFLDANGFSANNIFIEKSTEVLKSVISDKDRIKDLLLIGRQKGLPILKGKWEKTLGVWAGRAAAAIQVATAVYDAYAADKEQEKQNDAKRNHTVQLYRAVDQICSDFYKGIVDDVKKSLHIMFDPQIAELASLMNDINLQESEQKELMQKILESREAVSKVDW